MVELICFIIFCWLLCKALRLMFRAAWGLTKLIAVLLLILTIPVCVGVWLIASGIAMLVPVLLLWAVIALLKH